MSDALRAALEPEPSPEEPSVNEWFCNDCKVPVPDGESLCGRCNEPQEGDPT